MEIPSAIAAQSAISRQNVTLSVIKQNAEQGQQIAQLIDDAVQSAPVKGGRGSNVNITV